MKISTEELLPLFEKIIKNSYLKFVTELHITNYNTLKVRVDLNYDLACEFVYFVNWERYFQQLNNGKIINSLFEDIISEQSTTLINITDSYRTGQYDFTFEIPACGVFQHFMLQKFCLENTSFLSEGIMFKHLPDLNCYTYLNYSNRHKCHIKADISEQNNGSLEDINVSLGNKNAEELKDKFYDYLMEEFAGTRYYKMVSDHRHYLEKQSVELDTLLFYNYCTGDSMEKELNDGLTKELEKSLMIINDIIDNPFVENEVYQTIESALFIGTDGIPLINKFVLTLRKLFNEVYPSDLDEQIRLNSQEGALENLVKITIDKASREVTNENSIDNSNNKKNSIRLIPGFRHGNIQKNKVLYFDGNSLEHELPFIRNAPFDFLYYLSWLKNNGSNSGLNSTHSLTPDEIKSVCPDYTKLNRYLTGWVNVIMGQERPLKFRSEMKAEINKHFKDWFRNGIIQISPREEYVITPEIEIDLLPYDNDEYMSWIDKPDS